MFEAFEQMTHQYNRTCYEQLKEFIYRNQEAMFDQGDARRDQVKTPEALRRYNEAMRAAFVEAIGGRMSCDAPLNPRVAGRTDMGDYIVEAVVFNSRPRTYVTASLYIPKGVPLPGPAVLFLCGHAPLGRMDEDYQRVCWTLVKAGLIVLAMDPLGQGERSNFYDHNAGAFTIQRTSPDHDACGVPALTTGRTLQQYFLLDEMRAVDYMLTRPEIDPKRIGVTGNSGGGTQTMAMMAVDDRIAAAAPGTFVTSRREYMRLGQAQDAEQIWPGIAAKGFDHANPLMIFAPRPAMILAVQCDFFPIEGTLETYEAAKKAYALYGKADSLRLVVDNDTHAYTPTLAVRAAEFFSEVLGGRRITVDNSGFTPLPEEALRVTQTGQVKGEIRDARFVPQEVAAFAAELRAARLALPEETRMARARAWLTERVMFGRAPAPFHARVFPRSACVQTGGYMGVSVSWWTQKRLFAFGNLIKLEKDEGTPGMPTVLAVWEDGTKKIAAHETWIRAQCEAGYQVLVLDVPGMGAIEQRNMTLGASYKGAFGTLYTLCGNLLFMGDSMAAMRVWDVLRAIEMLGEVFGVAEKDVTLYCEGPEGVYGVMAAFLNERVGVRYGEGLLDSVERRYMRREAFAYDNSLPLLIPGMLAYFDYEELRR